MLIYFSGYNITNLEGDIIYFRVSWNPLRMFPGPCFFIMAAGESRMPRKQDIR